MATKQKFKIGQHIYFIFDNRIYEGFVEAFKAASYDNPDLYFIKNSDIQHYMRKENDISIKFSTILNRLIKRRKNK
jgi:hypothetical protein